MKLSDSAVDRLHDAANADDGELEPEIDEVFGGRYRIVGRLGSGGMSRVFEAHDDEHGRVAVKVMAMRGAAAHARFAREAALLSELRHPRIVRILDHGTTPTPWLATELYQGETLADRLARGPLAPSDAATLIGLVCEALAVLHDRGLLHRDLKPANVFLRADDRGAASIDRVVLLDFGLARALEDDDEITFVGTMAGTPGFIAPEVATGEAATPASDVFALGAVLAACLGDGATGPLVALADHMRADDRGARPANARAVARELSRIARGDDDPRTDAAPDWDAIERALESADPSARAMGGELAGRWFEAAGIFDVEGTEELARRLEQAGLPARAATWYRRAARLSFEQNDFVGLFARTRDSIRCGASPTEAGGLRLLEAQAAGWDNRPRDAIAHAEVAMTLLGEGSVAWLRALTEIGVSCARIGDAARIEAAATRVGQALDARAPRWIVVSAARLVTALSVAGRAVAARALCDRLELLSDATAAGDPLVAGRVALARSVCALFDGDIEMHVALLDRSASLVERAGDVRSTLHDRTNLGFALVELGACERAEAILEPTIAAASARGLRFVATLGKKNLAMVRVAQGRTAEAIDLATEAASGAAGNPRLSSVAHAYASFARTAEGDLEGATADAAAALAAAPGDPERARANGAHLGIAVARGDVADASHLCDARAPLLARAGTIDGGEARTWIVLVEGLRLVGRGAEADRALVDARARLRTRVDRIRDPVLRHGFASLPDHARLLGPEFDRSSR